ncbi:MAG: hypothetical protein AAF682_06570 [Planctomycetota bacterium]
MSRASTLAELLDGTRAGEVTVHGHVHEVCRSAGCWFVLRESSETRLHELYVDVAPSASFRVDPSALGRHAVVRGELVGSPPDLSLEAVGIRFDPVR